MRQPRQDAQSRPVEPDGGFDELPYPSMPFAFTQPAHLAALATLYGLGAPAADRACILELGCASGGNIIPLAARYPQATFTGVDLSERHIKDGRERIAALGLRNIQLQHGDLSSAEFAGQIFDYIICHGVFSWVPSTIQEAIFRICRDALASDGMAFISYNVLPGWHLRSIVRDICLHHAGRSGTARERVAGAREVLTQIAQSASEREPYGVFLRNEAERLRRLPAAYLLGEFLAPTNTPVHFQEFIGQARGYGLAYVCEADLGSSTAEMMYPATEQRIKALAGSDRLSEEQYKDFVSGRSFRRSVLVRSEREGQILHPPIPEHLISLHFLCRLNVEMTADGLRFRDHLGRSVTTKETVVERALQRLAQAYPSSLTFTELVEPDGCETTRDAADEMKVSNALFALLVTGQAGALTLPTTTGRASDERPKVRPLLRHEAASGQPWVTSLNHQPVPSSALPRLLLDHLDGTNNSQALKAYIVDALSNGMISESELKNISAGSSTSLEDLAGHYLERALRHLANNALLEP